MKNHPTFHLGNDHTDYYEQASYTWSEDSIRFLNTVNPSTRLIICMCRSVEFLRPSRPTIQRGPGFRLF